MAHLFNVAASTIPVSVLSGSVNVSMISRTGKSDRKLYNLESIVEFTWVSSIFQSGCDDLGHK